MPGVEKCESTLTGVMASSPGWSHRSEDNPTVVLLSWVRAAFCHWIQLDQNFLYKHHIMFFFFRFINILPQIWKRHLSQELCPENAYVPVLLPSLTCSSFNRETKPTQKTKDNTLNITQRLPCTPVSHFTFTQCVFTRSLYSQHYPEWCRMNRAVLRACKHWLPVVLMKNEDC